MPPDNGASPETRMSGKTEKIVTPRSTWQQSPGTSRATVRLLAFSPHASRGVIPPSSVCSIGGIVKPGADMEYGELNASGEARDRAL